MNILNKIKDILLMEPILKRSYGLAAGNLSLGETSHTVANCDKRDPAKLFGLGHLHQNRILVHSTGNTRISVNTCFYFHFYPFKIQKTKWNIARYEQRKNCAKTGTVLDDTINFILCQEGRS